MIKFTRFYKSAFGLIVLTGNALFAQLPSTLDVTVRHGILNWDGEVLPGNNPHAPAFGQSVTPGCLVQFIAVGADGLANWPQADGSISGDDLLLFTAQIGEGMPPDLSVSGRLDRSFSPAPAPLSRFYARVFNAPSLANASHWGQSALFEMPARASLFDLSSLGVIMTSIPLGSVFDVSDSDGDGMTDSQELLANTNASDKNDLPRLMQVDMVHEGGNGAEVAASELQQAAVVGRHAVVQFPGRAGRCYHLLRSTDLARDASTWETVASCPALSDSGMVQLTDIAPPTDDHVFYRVQVRLP